MKKELLVISLVTAMLFVGGAVFAAGQADSGTAGGPQLNAKGLPIMSEEITLDALGILMNNTRSGKHDETDMMMQVAADTNIRFNWKRGSVTDAKHIVRYVLEHVQPGWTCVDLGANVGAVSIPLWKKVGPDGRVISVEADPSNIARIRANLNLNNCPEGSVVNVAIANRKGTVQLRCYPAANGWQTLGNPSFAKDYQSFVIDVPAITFYELAESYGLESVDFVKIDVEGAEILVLAGMESFLRDKRIGCVIFEVNHLMLEGMGHTVSELLSFWDNLDYDLWRLNEDGITTPISNGWPDGLVGDCVALPRQ